MHFSDKCYVYVEKSVNLSLSQMRYLTGNVSDFYVENIEYHVCFQIVLPESQNKLSIVDAYINWKPNNHRTCGRIFKKLALGKQNCNIKEVDQKWNFGSFQASLKTVLKVEHDKEYWRCKKQNVFLRWTLCLCRKIVKFVLVTNEIFHREC